MLWRSSRVSGSTGLMLTLSTINITMSTKQPTGMSPCLWCVSANSIQNAAVTATTTKRISNRFSMALNPRIPVWSEWRMSTEQRRSISMALYRMVQLLLTRRLLRPRLVCRCSKPVGIGLRPLLWPAQSGFCDCKNLKAHPDSLPLILLLCTMYMK